ncbi:MAG: hypothetical protein ACOCP8_05700 [archaeon]
MFNKMFNIFSKKRYNITKSNNNIYKLYDIGAIANYFLDKKYKMNSMRLNKLLYFAQGCHLALF